jgi:hypothetical protein
MKPFFNWNVGVKQFHVEGEEDDVIWESQSQDP